VLRGLVLFFVLVIVLSLDYWVSWFFLDQFIHQSHVQVAQIEDEMAETDEEQAEFETFER
jgi:hypothetical protein